MARTSPDTDLPVRVTKKTYDDLIELGFDFRVRSKKQVIEILVGFAMTPEGKMALSDHLNTSPISASAK